MSGLVYVELIDSKGDVVRSISLPTETGVTWGGLAINANDQPGNYTFRAYTNWMQNFGPQYFFKKQLKIVSLTSPKLIAKAEVNRLLETKNIPKSYIKGNQKFDVQFLPEGGSWIADITQKMAFKAIMANGKGVEITGEVVDSKKNVVLQFRSNQKGMGYFKLTPKLNEEYTVVFKSPVDIKNQTLPKALPKGVSLQVANDFQSDSLSITIHNSLPNQELYLIGQSRGTLCFVSTIKANIPTKTIKVSKEIFPTGMSQIIILDANKQAINERSFFINHNNELKIALSTSQVAYSTRDSIPLHLKVVDRVGRPVIGSFSMAVTDDAQVAKDTLNDGNILTYLLLSSDLRGEIEDPGQYFNQTNEENHNDLEALVMTQGWTSYYNHPLIATPFKAEKDFTISGRVNNVLNKPIAKANITLLGRNKKPLVLQTVANNKGEFVFDNLPAMDSASLVIQALNAKDKKGTLAIELDQFKRPTIELIPQLNNEVQIEKADTIADNLIKVQQLAYVNTNGGQMLREINVVGKKVIKNSRNMNGAGEADLTFTPADLDKTPKKTVYQILTEKLTGFKASPAGKIHAINFYVNGSLTKFLIDGVYLDDLLPPGATGDYDYFTFIKSYLDFYTSEDLAGIEIMYSDKNSNFYQFRYLDPKSPLQYCFIEITTKSGSGPYLQKSANKYLYKPMDYGDLKVFYSPKYTSSTSAIKGNDFRSTLYWAPSLVTDEKGETSTSFFSSDKKGTYTVWLEGSDMLGNFGVKTMKLQIKSN